MGSQIPKPNFNLINYHSQFITSGIENIEIHSSSSISSSSNLCGIFRIMTYSNQIQLNYLFVKSYPSYKSYESDILSQSSQVFCMIIRDCSLFTGRGCQRFWGGTYFWYVANGGHSFLAGPIFKKPVKPIFHVFRAKKKTKGIFSKFF